MKFFQILLLLTFLAAVFNNSLSAVDFLFHGVSLCLMLLITNSQPFLKNFGKYVVLLTLWISLMFMPAFHLVKNLTGTDGLRGYAITPIDYERILSLGSKVLLISCASWIILSIFSQKTHKETIVYKPHLIKRSNVRLTFVFMFALSVFSMLIGLSRMGAKGIELPFHLAGIITLIRVVFFPIFFAVVVENHILCKKKVPTDYYLWFFIWALLEVFVRLSKSALINSFMVVAVVMYIYYRPNVKTIIRLAGPIIVLFLFLYPIVETMRSQGGQSLTEDFVSASKQVDEENTSENPLMQPLNRTFMIPHMYAKDYGWVNHNELFDFSKTPVLLAWGGSARYQTFVIDGYPLGIAHSSGTTAIEDPLLFGGYGLCYIVIVLLMVMGAAIDSMSYKHMWSIYIALIILLWNFSNSQNITTLTDAVGLQYIIARFVAIWAAYRMNFKRKIVISKQNTHI